MLSGVYWYDSIFFHRHMRDVTTLQIDECYICQNCNLAQEKQINLLVLEDIWTRGETFTEGFECKLPMLLAMS